MKLYIDRKRSGIYAEAEYDKKTKKTVVLKGAVLSEGIAYSKTFKSAKTIEKNREGKVIERILQSDVEFKRPSTAANFVTGCSTNGLTAWKDKNGVKLRELIKEL